ncbi:MAG TPA: mechanosensitive ion channel family protein [Isosphaeraceae bacterium]|nr:mechanosensitive ion channel family protein [Isosphaeraceae bacterium]
MAWTRPTWHGATIGVALIVLMVMTARVARAQLPGLPAPGGAAAGASKPKEKGVVTAKGPIKVRERIDDDELRDFLNRFLPEYPGVRSISVAVKDGVVRLRGRVDDDDTRDEITDVVDRVEGVRVVMNHTKTDDEVMTAGQFARREIDMIRDYLAKHWLLILVAITIVAFSAVAARLFNAHAETILSPFVRNPLLRSVAGSILSSFLLIGGVLLALSALKLSRAVLSILGFAGVVGLAVGFAFRDITENFIASVLLGVRRPFQVGDYVTVAGNSGVIQSLNTRATVLVTLDGNHVRIPNSVIFKETLVNSSASPSSRSSFDVVVPLESSVADAIASIDEALRSQPEVLADPPPRALVEAIEPGGVRLRAYFWAPTRGVDSLRLLSDLKLKVKVALQRLASPPPSNGPAPNPDETALANLRRDARAASQAPPAEGSGVTTPIERVMEQCDSRVSDEGENLLKNGPSRPT